MASLDQLVAEVQRKRQLIAALEAQIQEDRRAIDDVIASLFGRGQLSRRQQEVILLLRQRLSNKEIADNLKISVRTVKFHVSTLLEIFDKQDRSGLAQLTEAEIRAATMKHSGE